MRKLIKLVVSLFITFGLFILFNHYSTPVEAAAWNTDIAKHFGLGSNDMQYFTQDYYTGVWDVDIDPNNLSQTEFNITAVLALTIGHCYKSDINNALTIHYDPSINDYRVVRSSGNGTIDELLLTFVQGLGDTDVNNYVYHTYGKVTQPKFTVNGNEVRIYIPYVNYPYEVQQYLANNLEVKINALTGGDFNVTFACSKNSTVEKHGGMVTKDNPGFICSEADYDIANFLTIPELDVWIYKNREFPRNLSIHEPSYIELRYSSFYDLGSGLASRYGYEDNGYWQLYTLAYLAKEMFMCPFVVRVICEDYTMTVYPDDIVIESSTNYKIAIDDNNMW